MYFSIRVLLALVAAVFCVINTAYANTIFLDCFTLTENRPKHEFSVQLDEAAGRVSHTDRYAAFSVTAVYNAQQISYQQFNPEGFGLLSFRKYIINRATLDVSEFTTIKGTATQKSTSTTSMGACSVNQHDDRQP